MIPRPDLVYSFTYLFLVFFLVKYLDMAQTLNPHNTALRIIPSLVDISFMVFARQK